MSPTGSVFVWWMCRVPAAVFAQAMWLLLVGVWLREGEAACQRDGEVHTS